MRTNDCTRSRPFCQRTRLNDLRLPQPKARISFHSECGQLSLPLIQSVIQIALSVGETNGSIGPATRSANRLIEGYVRTSPLEERLRLEPESGSELTPAVALSACECCRGKLLSYGLSCGQNFSPALSAGLFFCKSQSFCKTPSRRAGRVHHALFCASKSRV